MIWLIVILQFFSVEKYFRWSILQEIMTEKQVSDRFFKINFSIAALFIPLSVFHAWSLPVILQSYLKIFNSFIFN